MQPNDDNPKRTPSLSSPDSPRNRDQEGILNLLMAYRSTRKPEIRDKIVLHYSNLVESVARRYSGATELTEDLAQEGYIGLITAIDLYDPTKNVKFSTYATHFIIGQIKHYLRDRGKIIKEPAWLQELNQKVTKTAESLSQKFGRPATNLEIAEALNMSEEQVGDMFMTREVFKVSSIDGGAEDDTSGAIDIERKRTKEPMVSFQLAVEDRIMLEDALHRLKELEQKVIHHFYYNHLNQSEIARRLGISCNYVSHILRNAAKKLRKILASNEPAEVPTNSRNLDEMDNVYRPNSLVDSLTRLYNRSYFDDRLSEELSRISREESELAVVCIRISGVEVYRRSCGIIKAQEVILGITHLLQHSTRNTDIITRYSEEMFAIIMPYTGANASVLADRLESKIRLMLASKSETRDSNLKLGVGVSLFPMEARQQSELTSIAIDRCTSNETSLKQAA